MLQTLRRTLPLCTPGGFHAEAKLVDKITSGKGHPKTKASGDDAKGLIKWVLSQ